MRLFVSAALSLAVMPAMAEARSGDEHPEAQAFIESLSFLEGEWELQNWLASGPSTSHTLDFHVSTTRTFDGLGLQSEWYAEDGGWYGRVMNTYDPEAGMWQVYYFDGHNNRWSNSAHAIELTETGYSLTSEGEDAYGPFESRTRFERISDDAYRSSTERRYPGTDWFPIDRIEATRSE